MPRGRRGLPDSLRVRPDRGDTPLRPGRPEFPPVPGRPGDHPPGQGTGLGRRATVRRWSADYRSYGATDPTTRAPWVEALAEFGEVKGEEFLYPLAFDEPSSLFDYLVEGALVFLVERERLSGQADAIAREYAGLYRKAALEGPVPPPETQLVDFEERAEALGQGGPHLEPRRRLRGKPACLRLGTTPILFREHHLLQGRAGHPGPRRVRGAHFRGDGCPGGAHPAAAQGLSRAGSGRGPVGRFLHARTPADPDPGKRDIRTAQAGSQVPEDRKVAG